MKTVSIFLLLTAILMLIVYPGLFFIGAMGGPFILLGFAAIAYVFSRVQTLEKK